MNTIPDSPTDPAPPATALARLDAWMASSPWHPRIVPFFAYIFGLFIASFLTEPLPVTIPFIYTAQVALVVFLLVRYRKLMPEMTLRFHWLAVPTGVGLLFAWVYLGYATNWLSAQAQGTPVLGPAMDHLVPTNPTGSGKEGAAPHPILAGKEQFGAAWFWATMTTRLLGMSIVVPLFEELFIRSAVIRATRSSRRTKNALLQLASDLPIIGDTVANSKAGKQANALEPQFTQQLVTTPVGFITVFSVFASTFIFLLSHQRRDYLGCIACGIVWSWLVWYVNKPKPGQAWDDQPDGGRTGLGPISWSHGITNALLWGWTLRTGDWQFL
ncbi:MAG: hypothetical protein AAGC44_05400 [Planctomycetota bacterium]